MKLFTIQKHGAPNIMLGIHCAQRSYVVAFRSHHTAAHVANHLHKMPRLVLNDNINILTIYKTNQALANNHDTFDVTEYMFDDLVIHPFKNCVGLIMPFDLIKDDSSHFVFQTDIIQPCSEDVCALVKYGVRNPSAKSLDA